MGNCWAFGSTARLGLTAVSLKCECNMIASLVSHEGLAENKKLRLWRNKFG